MTGTALATLSNTPLSTAAHAHPAEPALRSGVECSPHEPAAGVVPSGRAARARARAAPAAGGAGPRLRALAPPSSPAAAAAQARRREDLEGAMAELSERAERAEAAAAAASERAAASGLVALASPPGGARRPARPPDGA